MMEVDDEARPSTQLHGRNQRKTSQISRTQNWAKVLQKSQKKKNGLHTWRRDSIIKISYIDKNQTSTRCGNRLNILPLFGRLERIPHNLSTPLTFEAHNTTKKAQSKPRCGGGLAEVLASPPALGVLFIGKLMTKLPLWPNTKKTVKLG
jgi:hypothetical protein